MRQAPHIDRFGLQDVDQLQKDAIAYGLPFFRQDRQPLPCDFVVEADQEEARHRR